MRLSEYRSLRREIESLKERRVRIMADLTRVTQKISGMPRGSGSGDDKLLKGMAKLDDIDKQLGETVDRYIDTCSEILADIDGLEDSTAREVLRLRYVDGLSWGRIARTTHYSKSRLYQIHSQALRELRDQ